MENKNFQYTYSAKEQEEIKKIREKYSPSEDGTADKMEKLRRLDAGVTNKATVVSLIWGILGALLLGTGMSLIMTDLGQALFVNQWEVFAVGIGIGVIGGAFICIAYPAYCAVIKKEREKIAPEIIRLSDELMK